MKLRVQQEAETHGSSTDLERFLPALFDKVIPRLLRPSHTGDYTIKPVLVHGDMWCGNLAIDAETDEPVVSDPATI